MAMSLARFRRKTKMKVRAGQLKTGKQKWRRGRDLNPRYPLRYVRFRGGSFQPLTHLSGKQLLAVGSWPLAFHLEPAQDFQLRRPVGVGERPKANHHSHFLYRLFLKKACNTSAQRPASTPARTSIR